MGRSPRAPWQAVTAGGADADAPGTGAWVWIRPPRTWESPGLRELWASRELLFFLVWRAVKVRYKQTVIGAGWAMLQPVLTMIVFAVVFGGWLAVPSDGVPYPLFAYAALLPWTFFASAVTQASNSLVYDANLISKVYFPRLVIPIGAVLAPVVDLAFAFAVLLAMLVASGTLPGVTALALPLFLLLALATALAVGLWLSALNVKYRDVGYAVPFLVNLWLFATPVVYPSSVVPDQWRTVFALNPLVSVVEGFRWSLFGGSGISIAGLVASSLIVGLMLVSGLAYFRRTESQFADVV